MSSNKQYSTVILINIDNFNKTNATEVILHFKLRDELRYVQEYEVYYMDVNIDYHKIVFLF